jgi:hypothetical protein
MYANPYLYIFCNASNPQRFHEKFGEVDLEPVFALAQNPDKMPTMTSAHGVCHASQQATIDFGMMGLNVG